MNSKLPNIGLEAGYAKNAEQQKYFTAATWRHLELWCFVVVRILFGTGWLLAGLTKITEKAWFSEPGVFLTDYLIQVVANKDVPGFYRAFIEHAALPHVLVFNYAIPVAQIVILSGNMNAISLVLYTSAFLLLLSGNRATGLSVDRYFNCENIFALNRGYHTHDSLNCERPFRRSLGTKLGR